MLDYDPKTSLQLHPLVSTARYGVNPFQENLFRIVFAPSRRYLVFGDWPNGERGARWQPKYDYLGNTWILERWKSAHDFTGGLKPEQWDRDPKWNILGPYPSRGEYELCHVFEASSPTDANLDKLVMWIQEGDKRSYWENRTACQNEMDAEQKSTDSTMTDIIKNSMSAFGVRPMVGYGGGRGSKSKPILKSANELGLPIGNNKLKQMRTA